MQSTSTILTPALPQPPRPISTLGKLNSVDGKRQPRLKEISFVFKHGQRHHAYDSEKAPYPISYDREVLELESLDNRFTKYLRNGSVSFVNFEEPPERVLDLGCGMGTWIIDAAKEWTDCEFVRFFYLGISLGTYFWKVGFDLVNIQIPTNVLDESLQARISWVHGNFLTTKLPFEDDEFDHVHVQSIARAVPENKWDNLFERYIVFPFLPRWFTAPLRARPRRSTSVHFPDGSQRGYPSPQDTLDEDTPSHDHALLESLYKAVFAHRFINMKPSALLPNYFTTYFRHCTVGPVISWPMPPIPPLQPLPDQMVTSYAVDSGAENPDLRMSTVFPLSADGSPSPSSGPMNTRPNSLSFSSTISSRSTMNSSTNESSLSTLFSTMGREKSGSVSSTSSEKANSEMPLEDESVKSAGGDSDATLPIRIATPPPKFVPFLLESSSADSTTVPSIPSSLFPAVRLASMNERSLAMHLYRSYTIVLACREPLWEELKDRLRNRRDELRPFGWEDDDDFEETQNRKKFEKLIERYQNDMQARASLWCSLNNIGWPFPPREPLKKAELVEEQRMREAMLEARKHAPAEDLQVPCRTARTLVGYKPLVT
ncbi:hypothetical protein BDZ89DRAFT_1100020 [Hymenopellis radicata]|nr:hypothetical protein BDZ89DRAFT_1100020 [Hymenopellis radicata]